MIGIFFDTTGADRSIEVGVVYEGNLGRDLGLNGCRRKTEGVVSWDIILGGAQDTVSSA